MESKGSNCRRVRALLVVCFVIPLGLLARSYRPYADHDTLVGFLALYAGDTLWPIMFFFAGRALSPRARTRTLLCGTLLLTLLLEFGQLWRPEWLQMLRRQPVVGFVIGNSFVWSDVYCLLVGGVLASALDSAFSRHADEKSVDAQ